MNVHSRISKRVGAALAAASAAPFLFSTPARSDNPPRVITATSAPTTLGELQRQARGVRRQMRRLNAEMKAIYRRWVVASVRLEAITADLNRTRLQLAQAQGDLESQATLTGHRLAAMYKLGEYGWLDVLAGSGGFADLQSRADFFALIGEQDRSDGAELARLADEVRRLENALDAQRQDALAVENEIDGQRVALEDAIAQRQALLNDLTQQIRTLLSRRPHSSLGGNVPTHGPYTLLTWAQALLQRLRMPVTADNVAAIVAWETAEGGHWHNTARYNPLNTTQPMPGATAMNSVGVKAYRDWDQGFEATIITLHNGFYPRILAALRTGNDAVAVAIAVGASPWGTGNFAGLLSGRH
jgi:peptidoglycan hydrolase CwlO-like protein